MAADFWLVVRWWGVLFFVGAAAFPLTKVLFGKRRDSRIRGNDTEGGWFDDGYFFAKAVGMALVTYLVFFLGTLHILPFALVSIVVSLVGSFVFGMVGFWLHGRAYARDLQTKRTARTKTVFLLKSLALKKEHIFLVFIEELFFFVALLLWSWVKAHEPSIHNLEKFMDYGFMKSILESRYFPPPDMWYTPFPINYYYFGHMVVAVLTKLSGIDLAVTFNLMLASIFALTFTMSFSIGLQAIRIGHIGRMRPIGRIAGAFLTAFLVTLAGNMQTIYAFTRGYTGDDVKPFWQLLWKAGEFWAKLPEGMERYWYANATRFIPFTIHEFPSYSFVVSDVHGHVLSLPFVLLAIGLLIKMFTHRSDKTSTSYETNLIGSVFYGFLIAVLLMTNALDGPIYFGLFLLLAEISNFKFQISNAQIWKERMIAYGSTIGTAGVVSLPFLLHFKSFVTGLAVNCPPAFLANSKIGPLLFESVEKCQHSPLWMMALLWGFFWFCGVRLILRITNGGQIWRDRLSPIEKLLITCFLFSMALIIFPEFFYFKDIYPAHFRSNTMFKLGYDAFILFSIVAGYTITQGLLCMRSKITNYKLRITNGFFLFFLIPQLFLVSVYPFFSVRSYFDSLRQYQGLDGLAWFKKQYPDDWAGIEWLNTQLRMRNYELRMGNKELRSPVIVEADGDSYTDYDRVSVLTGYPTVVGWAVHEWLWRGTYDVVAPRREEVRKIYESMDLEETKTLLDNYHIRYIFIGTLEREKFKSIQERKFGQIGKPVFVRGGTRIYEVNP